MKTEYRTALITGASSGLGRGLAAWFARRGTRVFAVARRLENLNALRDEAQAAGGVVEPVRLDVADYQATLEKVRAIDDECGGLDLVVANAGVGEETPGWQFDWEKAEQVLQVNVMGAAATLSAVLPRMVERNQGHLVGVSSISSFRGMPKMAAYSGSKAFLSTFLESLRVDLVGTGVAVTAIHPGFVRTEMTAKNKLMPLVIEAEDASERMAKAIMRRDGEFSFPTPTALAGKTLAMIPDGVLGRAMKAAAARRKAAKQKKG